MRHVLKKKHLNLNHLEKWASTLHKHTKIHASVQVCRVTSLRNMQACRAHQKPCRTTKIELFMCCSEQAEHSNKTFENTALIQNKLNSNLPHSEKHATDLR